MGFLNRDVDIPLTEKGIMEALAGGRAVSEIDFDIVFTSRLVRAKQTALIAMTQVRIHRRMQCLIWSQLIMKRLI